MRKTMKFRFLQHVPRQMDPRRRRHQANKNDKYLNE